MAAPSNSADPIPLSRRLVAGGAGAVLLAMGLMWLLGRPGPAFSTRPFMREASVHKGWTFVRLAVKPLPDGTFEQTTRVRVEPGAGLERASAVSFQFDLYREGTNSGHVTLSVELVRGEISTPDGRVRFELPPGSWLREKELVRIPRATPPGVGEDARELVLRFVTRGVPRMALESNTVDYFPDSTTNNVWSWVRGPGQTRVFAPPGAPVYASMPIGQFEFPLQGENVDRAEILAFLWDLPSGRVVKTLALLLSALAGLGMLLVPWGQPGRRWQTAAAVALLFGAVSGGYALISPPLDAPDEQDHLLSFLLAAKVPDARQKVMDFAARNHWDRWQAVNSQFEKISADDRLAPYVPATRDWATSGLIAQERSGLGGHYWRAIRGMVIRDSLPNTLLRLRLANALTCTGFAFLGVLLFLLRTGPNVAAPWVPLMLALMTPVAYLAMATSNYILVVGCGIVLAGAVSLGQPTRRAELASWFFAALAAGVAVQSSRSGLTLLGFTPVLAWRWFQAAGREGGVPAKDTLFAWALIAAGLLLPWAFSSPDYRAEVAEGFSRLGGGTLGWLLNRMPFPLWVLVAAIGGAAVERIAAFLGHGNRAQVWRRAAESASVLGWLIVPLVVAVVVWFQFEKVPPTPTNGRELSAFSHVAHGFGRFLGSLGPGQHDYLLSLTYWNIMGWLEVKLPEWTVDLFSTFLLVGWVLLWVRAARHRDGAGLVRVAILSAACFGYLAAMLLATRAAGYTLVGRYMVIFFTVFLTVCWKGWQPMLVRLTESRPQWTPALWVSLPVAMHLFCWRLILNHFF